MRQIVVLELVDSLQVELDVGLALPTERPELLERQLQTSIASFSFCPFYNNLGHLLFLFTQRAETRLTAEKRKEQLFGLTVATPRSSHARGNKPVLEAVNSFPLRSDKAHLPPGTIFLGSAMHMESPALSAA